MELKCKVCQKLSPEAESFVKHFDLLHRVGPHSFFLCGVVSCSLNFKTLERYRKHLDEFHNETKQPQPIDDRPFKCAFCDYKCSVRSTLRVHRKRNHSGATTCDSTSRENVEEFCENVEEFCENEGPTETSNVEGCEPDMAVNMQSIVLEDKSERDILSTKILHFYLTLSSKFHIPESTIQFLIDSYHTYVRESGRILKDDLLKKMVEAGIDHDKSCDIVNDAFENELFIQMHSSTGPLRSAHIRRKNFISNFKFVAPKSRKLGLNDNNEVRTFHTVSIKKTLQALLGDDEIYEQYVQSQNIVPSSEYFKDIFDGSLLSTHPVRVKDPTAIFVIFYEDDLELANALDSAKTVHKLTAVEYTFSFLRPWCRMKKDTLQVALLCAEKDIAYFGLTKVLAPVMKQLKKLGEIGVEIRGKMVKVIPLMLLGDNLGTHTFTGFVENFSKVSHFCRYCEESRVEWLCRWHNPVAVTAEENDSSEDDSSENDVSSDEETSDEDGDCDSVVHNFDLLDLAADVEVDKDLPTLPVSTAPLRTAASYNECVRKAKESPLTHYKGVVGECEFNKLEHFHCIGASPPCVPHDMFEGVLAYDVPLILKYLMKTFDISVDYVNRKIKGVKLLGTDRNDRPAKISVNMKKLHGNAIQNWNFLRFLPLYIGDKVTDKTDKVWKMLLHLIELNRILCSPSLPRDGVPILGQKIHLYLTMRVTYFPDVRLRPKHHFLEHYAHLMTVFGNLMRVSTLGFESKHRFYKDTVAKKKNFKNITKTLSVEHQLAMSALTVDSLMSSYPTVVNGLPLQHVILSDDISDSVYSFFGLEFLNTAAFSEKVTYRGTCYSKGAAVVTYSGSSGQLDMCLIETLIVRGTDCYAAGWLARATLIPSYQLYNFRQTAKCVVVNLERIADYISYPVYNLNNNLFVMLKHMPFL